MRKTRFSTKKFFDLKKNCDVIIFTYKLKSRVVKNYSDFAYCSFNEEKAVKKKIKDEINNEDKLSTQTDKVGMGIFSMLFVFILFIGSIILLLDTFKFLLVPIWPDLEDYLVYAFETINNIYILSKDFFIPYK